MTPAQTTDRDTPVMQAVYRHDVHKFLGHAHEHAADTHCGVPVNEPVPLDADADAAMLSRPADSPEQTVPNHTTPHRLALTSGQPAPQTPALNVPTNGDIAPLLAATDPAVAHARWLTSRIPAAYHESIYYPYTSLQYHTLLTAALLAAYRAGHDFADLRLVATPPSTDTPPTLAETTDAEAARAEAIVEPHSTILWTPTLALHLRPATNMSPGASLGAQPARSFSDVWSRLPTHPINTDAGHRARLLDAQLRRIRAWSTALAYIDDYSRTDTRTEGPR